MTRRKVIVGSVALIVAALAYSATNFLLPEKSRAALAVSDFGIMAMEGATIGLGLLAFKRAAGRDDRWLWGLLTLWAFANLLGGAGRAFYDLALGREVPSISVADIGYLLAYPLACLTLIIGAKRAAGRARTLMVALDAVIFTSGLAGISWPFLLEPLARTSGPSAGFWVTLAYPVGDLVVILCFVILMFASINARLPKYMFAICAAFIVQVIADAAHVAIVSRGGTYLAGSWPAGLWTLGIAFGGAAALLGMESAGRRVSEQTATSGKASLTQPVDARLNPPIAPLVLPYVSLPIVAGMIGLQLITDGPRWNKELQVLTYLGLGLVLLLLARQSLTVAQNRGLTNRLSRMSQELGQRVEDLAQLTGDLETLNAHADYLNGLKSLTEVAAESVDIACWATGSRAGWIILTEDGQEKVIAYCDDRDNADQSPPDATHQQPGEELQAVPLLAQGVVIGTIFLVDPKLRNRKLDLTHMIAAHVATALDNARRYEEALRFAERDPLTGLLNHRAIHAHLIEEGGRAERNRSEVSVLMLDLDDFKLLNDTFGHPAGDRVLRRVGETARRVLRQSDRAGRVGGDELMIVLPDTGGDGAAYLSERLREELVSNPFAISEGNSITLRLSIGAASFPQDATTMAELVEVADDNLYISKQRGGNIITTSRAQREASDEHDGWVAMATALLGAVGSRDHYTRRHSEQVVTHALTLGRALGLPDDSLQTLRLAALVHDVGNIGVPTDVFRKRGALDDQENEAVRKHVDVSTAIIADMPRLRAVLEAVKAHHERPDGLGYPNGLLGDDIPQLAKILAVADTYAALTADRPYRKSMDGEEARAELLRAAGTELDPELVQKFLHTLAAQRAEAAPTLK